MSKTKSNIHSILCDYEFLYEYRGKLSFFNDFEKNKGFKKSIFILFSFCFGSSQTFKVWELSRTFKVSWEHPKFLTIHWKFQYFEVSETAVMT